MSTQTPRAPPRPVAALLSPILWRLNSPDRFDMYSVGITFLQMVFGPLQSDNGLAAFNKRLEAANYDLAKWREQQEKRGGRDWQEGFAVMDFNDGAAWDFACQLVQYEPEKRMTAAAALKHPCISGAKLGRAALRAKGFSSAAEAAAANLVDPWISVSASGTQRRAAGLTEAQITELAEENGSSELPEALKNASATISWWQGRQANLNKQLAQRKSKLAQGINKAVAGGGKNKREKVRR